MPYEEKDAGVAFVFCRNTGRILLERRSAHVNNPHTIGLFGGAREDTAESYGETATRELYEETGLNLKPIRVIRINERTGCAVFIVDEEVKPRKLSKESSGFMWVSELPEAYRLHPAMAENVRLYTKLWSRLKELQAKEDPDVSPELLAWFKDSKVVDAGGRPLRMFHGSSYSIKEFSHEYIGHGNDEHGPGFYFTSRPDVASSYQNDPTAQAAVEVQPWPSNLDRLEHVQDLPGSTGPKLMRDTSNSARYILKTGRPEIIDNAITADRLYEKAGASVPGSEPFYGKLGEHVTKLSRFVQGTPLGEYLQSADPEAQQACRNKIREHFIVDALLANWDVLGGRQDNVIVDEDGTPYRIDNSGALEYRALGEPREFGDQVNEIDSMRCPETNPVCCEMFGDLTADDLRSQYQRIWPDQNSINSFLESAPWRIQTVLRARMFDMHQRLFREVTGAIEPPNAGPNVMPVYLRIRKPVGAVPLTRVQLTKIIMRASDDALTNFGDVDHYGRAAVIRDAVEAFADQEDPKHQVLCLGRDLFPGEPGKYLEILTAATGYDGILVHHPRNTIAVVFHPNQIKSVFNSGSYSRRSNDVIATVEPQSEDRAFNTIVRAAKQVFGSDAKEATSRTGNRSLVVALRKTTAVFGAVEIISREGHADVHLYPVVVSVELKRPGYDNVGGGVSRTAMVCRYPQKAFEQLKAMVTKHPLRSMFAEALRIPLLNEVQEAVATVEPQQRDSNHEAFKKLCASLHAHGDLWIKTRRGFRIDVGSNGHEVKIESSYNGDLLHTVEVVMPELDPEDPRSHYPRARLSGSHWVVLRPVFKSITGKLISDYARILFEQVKDRIPCIQMKAVGGRYVDPSETVTATVEPGQGVTWDTVYRIGDFLKNNGHEIQHAGASFDFTKMHRYAHGGMDGDWKSSKWEHHGDPGYLRGEIYFELAGQEIDVTIKIVGMASKSGSMQGVAHDNDSMRLKVVQPKAAAEKILERIIDTAARCGMHPANEALATVEPPDVNAELAGLPSIAGRRYSVNADNNVFVIRGDKTDVSGTSQAQKYELESINSKPRRGGIEITYGTEHKVCGVAGFGCLGLDSVFNVTPFTARKIQERVVDLLEHIARNAGFALLKELQQQCLETRDGYSRISDTHAGKLFKLGYDPKRGLYMNAVAYVDVYDVNRQPKMFLAGSEPHEHWNRGKLVEEPWCQRHELVTRRDLGNVFLHGNTGSLNEVLAAFIETYRDHENS